MSQIVPAPPDGEGNGSGAPHGRRDFLQKVGIGAALAWTAPSIVSVTAAGAATVAPLPDPLTFIAVGPDPYVWRSTDGGATWAVATTPLPAASTAIKGVATDGLGTWVAVRASGTSPFALRSVDDGLTWSAATTGPATARNVVAVTTRSTGTTWIALRAAGGVPSATATSTDGGDTWTGFASGVPVSVAGLAVGRTVSSVDPDDRTWIAVLGTNAYRSTDDFATFTIISVSAADVGSTLKGVATDGSGNWVVVNGNGSGADLRRAWISGDDGLTWAEATIHPDGVCTGVATDGSGTWVAAGRNINNTVGVAPDSWISTDNGATWTTNSTNAAFYNAVATDAFGHWVATDTTVGSRRGWSSTDAGSSWIPGTPLFGVNIAAVAAGRLLP